MVWMGRGAVVGGRVGILHEEAQNQQVVEFGALEFSVNFPQSMGWNCVSFVGDNFSVVFYAHQTLLQIPPAPHPI